MAYARRPNLTVTAVVVTQGASEFLPRTLRGLAAQTIAPHRVVLVDAGPRPSPCPAPDGGELVEAPSPNLAAALAAVPDIDDEWIWILHDDSAPAPDCLEQLLRLADSGPTVGMVGAKQRGWTGTDVLLEVGLRTTASGRRTTDIDDGDIDQGQLDSRSDVLGVGTAGALVRREALTAVGGFDPALGPFGDGLELSRRLWRGKWRVVVAPRAIVYHARASYRAVRHGADPDPRRSFAARRRAQLHYWLSGARWWALPFLLPYVVMLGGARALWRVATKQSGLAVAEMQAVGALLTQLPALRHTRQRSHQVAQVGPGILRPLQATSRELFQRAYEANRHNRAEQRAAQAPSNLELQELASLARQRRWTLGAVLAVTGLASAVVFGPLGWQLTGGAYAGFSGSWRDLAQYVRADMVADGLQLTGGLDPFAFVVLGLTLPFALVGVNPGPVLALLHAAALPLAALTAWAAAGAATRRVSLRAWAALAWAAHPSLLLGLSAGRTAPALAHVFLPLVALFLARTWRLERVDVLAPVAGQGRGRVQAPTRMVAVTAAAGAGLALAIVLAGAPLLFGAAVLAVGVLAWKVRRSRWRLVWAVTPAAALLAPLVWQTVRQPASSTWRAWFASPGLPLGEQSTPPLWATLGTAPARVIAAWQQADLPGPARLPLGLWLAPVAAMGLLACWQLVTARQARVAVWLGVGLAAMGALLAVIAPWIAVGVGPLAGVRDQFVLVRGWSGPGASLLTFGLAIAALAGRPQPVQKRWWVPARRAGAVVGSVGCVAGLVAWVALCQLAADFRLVERAPQLPAAVAYAQDAPYRSRVLVLEPGADLRVAVRRGTVAQLTDISALTALAELQGPGPAGDRFGAGVRPVAGADLEVLVALTSALTGTSDARAASTLAHYAIDGVVVRRHADTDADGLTPWATTARLATALDTVGGLRRATRTEDAILWRVGSADPQAPSAHLVAARMRLSGETGVRPLPAGPVHADVVLPAGTWQQVEIAETDPSRWRLLIDGQDRPLRAEEGILRADVPAGAQTLSLSQRHPGATLWWLVRAGVFALAALLALPLRRAKSGGQAA